MRLGQLLRRWVEDAAEFELLAPVPFSTIVFRARPCGMNDEAELRTLNERVLAAFNGMHRYSISSTEVAGRFALRLTIGNFMTTEQVIRDAWTALRHVLRRERLNVASAATLQSATAVPTWSYWHRHARKGRPLSTAA